MAISSLEKRDVTDAVGALARVLEHYGFVIRRMEIEDTNRISQEVKIWGISVEVRH